MLFPIVLACPQVVLSKQIQALLPSCKKRPLDKKNKIVKTPQRRSCMTDPQILGLWISHTTNPTALFDPFMYGIGLKELHEHLPYISILRFSSDRAYSGRAAILQRLL